MNANRQSVSSFVHPAVSGRYISRSETLRTRPTIRYDNAEQRNVLVSLLWWPQYCQAHRELLNCAGASFRGFVIGEISSSDRTSTEAQRGATTDGPLVILPRWRESIPEDFLIRQLWDQDGLYTGLPPGNYFNHVAQIYKSILIPPRFLRPPNHFTASPDEVKMEFAKLNGLSSDEFAVDCDAGALSGVRVRLSRRESRDKSRNQPLPSACMSERLYVIAYMPLAE
jgi:ribonuclease I